MNLKWCALTGALIIISGFAITLFAPATGDPPGVTTRWWNGTVETIEEIRYDGSRTVTTFGDDGQTVVKYERFDYDGKLRQIAQRLPEGTVETKWFRSGGELERYTLRSPDERDLLEAREYHPDGTLQREEIYTKDGRMLLKRRTYDKNGKLKESEDMRPNGDRVSESYYSNGNLKSRSNYSLGGKYDKVMHYSDGTLYYRETVTDKESHLDTYDREGRSLVHRTSNPDGTIHFEVSDEGKLVYRQTWKPYDGLSHFLHKVEEYDSEGKFVERSVSVDIYGRPEEIERYRGDGTLKSRQRIRYERSSRTPISVEEVEFDESGKTELNTVEDSKPGKVSSKRLNIPDTNLPREEDGK